MNSPRKHEKQRENYSEFKSPQINVTLEFWRSSDFSSLLNVSIFWAWQKMCVPQSREALSICLDLFALDSNNPSRMFQRQWMVCSRFWPMAQHPSWCWQASWVFDNFCAENVLPLHSLKRSVERPGSGALGFAALISANLSDGSFLQYFIAGRETRIRSEWGKHGKHRSEDNKATKYNKIQNK